MPQPPPVSPPGGGIRSVFRPALFSMGGGYQAPPAACASCPASLWYQDDQIRCFCNIMKVPTWPPASKPVIACDGRESAVAQWEQQQSKR